jgi:hypothetical protein
VKLPSLNEFELNSNEVKLVLDSLILDEDKRQNINLSTRGPKPLFFCVFGQELMIDYRAILSILMTKTHPISQDIDNKGTVFEKMVFENLKSINFNLWECQKKLKHSDNTSRQVDITFIYKDILFIAELKSIVRSMDYEIGKSKALEFRKNKLVKALKQCEKTSDWLMKHQVGTNFELPKNIKFIVPIVITPFPEYIWTKDNQYWLTQNISRICLVSELKDLINDKAYCQIINRPFIRKIK